MSDPDMLAQDHSVKSAIEAYHVVTLHRPTDRNRRRPRLLRWRRAPETGERSTDLDDQPDELIDTDLVMPRICGDNARDEMRIDLPYEGAFSHRLPRKWSSPYILGTDFLQRVCHGWVKTSKYFSEVAFCGSARFEGRSARH